MRALFIAYIIIKNFLRYIKTLEKQILTATRPYIVSVRKRVKII